MSIAMHISRFVKAPKDWKNSRNRNFFCRICYKKLKIYLLDTNFVVKYRKIICALCALHKNSGGKMKNEPKQKQYGYALANVYDILNDGIDHAKWADFYEECISRFSDIPVSEICETACGTGGMALEMAKRGYDVTASDISGEMLTAAESKVRSAGFSVRFVLQDMRNIKMYSQKDFLLCMLDSMNYLTSRADIAAALECAFKALKPGGLFVFDMNSKHKFECVYADNAYVLEDDGVYCGWENSYNPKTKNCDFYLSIFMQNPDGSYRRENEVQRERMYTVRQMTGIIAETGFELCGIFGSEHFEPANENVHDRLFYVLKKTSSLTH